MKMTEIRQQEYKALIDALGVTGTLRFLQQLEVGYGDYTKERHQWLDQFTIDDFRNYVKQKKIEEQEQEHNYQTGLQSLNRFS